MTFLEPITNIDPKILILYLGLIVPFLMTRGDVLLMFFQQEEYDGPRFMRWWWQKRAFDRTLSLWAGIGAVAAIAALSVDTFKDIAEFFIIPGNILLFVGLLLASRKSYRLVKTSKKPLVKTMRAKRILWVFYGLAAMHVFIILYLAGLAPSGERYSLGLDRSGIDISSSNYDATGLVLILGTIILAQALPFLLVLANKILEPFEVRVKSRFREEAVATLNKHKPKIIAITGSFGKTSTKHILSHILSSASSTLMTPGSVNTEMGIVRIIREQLRSEHDYFIVEMGAYGPGSIARLCALTPPDVGLITAVGAAHYERFRSLDTVAKAKFELGHAVLARGGTTIVQKGAIPENLLKTQIDTLNSRFENADIQMVGTDGDHQIQNIDETPKGINFTLVVKDEETDLFLPLFGRHQAENAALAAIAARAIGLPWSHIKAAMATCPQIRHRLEVTKIEGGPYIIDDAYNANPVGFTSALKCLDILRNKERDGRRILITPGLVELGEEHDSIHRQLGTLTAKHCDIVAVVTPERIESFVQAFETQNPGGPRLIRFAKQQDAEDWVKSEWRDGDAVLFENNLPDLYENLVRL